MRRFVPPRNRPNQDVVFTPPPLAKEVIDHFPLSGTVLEPCMGDGAFYDQFPPSVEKKWCEITKGRNFFCFAEEVDWIVTNPPWSKMMEFLKHSLALAPNVLFLVTISHLVTKARMRLICDEGFGFKEIYGVPQPDYPWPASGFQLAAIHLCKDWKGPTIFSGKFGR